MPKAVSRLSTPPANTSATTPRPSRSDFLVQAAGVAAGGAALGAGLPLPALAAATAGRPDAILAAIEAHQRAVAALEDAVGAGERSRSEFAPRSSAVGLEGIRTGDRRDG
jgi:hypothetical protein